MIVAALVLAGILARPAGFAPTTSPFIAVGIVPGAVIGGRLGYFLVHAGFYGSPPTSCSTRRSAGWTSVWPWSAGS